MRTTLVFLCMCFGVQGMKGISNITLGSIPTKERNRRLIPYMTYYLGQPQNPQFRQVMAVPVLPVPQYRQIPQRYLQQPSPLTRMITQNYLTITKQLQGNPRLQTRLVNPNISPELKYYVPVPLQQQNVVQIPASQYPKHQNVLQYVKQENENRYIKPTDIDDYDSREQEPQNNGQYGKPSADTLLQYVKPEVQQYVMKYRAPAQYPKQEQADYEDQTSQNRQQIRYITKPPVHQYLKNEEPQQFIPRPENDGPVPAYAKPENDGPVSAYAKPENDGPVSAYAKPENDGPVPAYAKPETDGRIQSYAPKQVLQFIPKLRIIPSKLAPQPAEYPEYITRPIPKPQIQPNGEQTSVSIMQSQEIDVGALPTTPSSTPKYHAVYVAKPENYSPYQQPHQTQYEEKTEEDLDPEVVDKNLNDVLEGLSISKSLPERITTENLGSSIKTLSRILKILQRAHALPQSAKDIVKGFPNPTDPQTKVPSIKIRPQSRYNDGSTPGRPGVDYPNYDEIPQTSFSCKEQRYKGFFGDPETGCQVWHYCDLNGGQASFLCPNGTIFSQVALTCDWWFNVKCATTAQLYVLNERLYKYILPQKPSFPEDFSGPLVDHYIALKFKEIEEKNKNKTEEAKDENKEEEYEPPFSIDVESQNKVRSVG